MGHGLGLDRGDAPLGGGKGFEAAVDQGAALGGGHNDMAGPQFLGPIGTAGDGKGARGEEAMALGESGRGESMPVIIAVAQVERHHGAIEQAGDPAQWAHPGEPARSAPAHGFRPGEFAQHGRQGGGHQGGGIDAGHNFVEHPEIALLAKVVLRGAMFAQKAGEGLFGRVAARAALAAAAFGNGARDFGGKRNTAGAMEGPHLGGCDCGQRLAQQSRKIIGRAGLHACRDFLGEQFDKKLRHGPSPPRPRLRNSLWPGCEPGRYSLRAPSR